MLDKLFLLVDYFIPDSIKQSTDLFDVYRARLMVIFAPIILALSLTSMALTQTYPKPFLVINLYLIFHSILNLTAFRYLNLSTKVMGLYNSLAFFICLCSFLLVQKHFISTTIMWFIPCLMVADLLVSQEICLLLFFLTLGVISLHWNTYSPQGITPPSFTDVETWKLNLLKDQVNSFVLSFLILSIYRMARNSYYQQINRTQDELLAQQEIMFKQSRMSELGEVAGGIAHEINNPLSIIQVHAQKLIKRGKDEKDPLNRNDIIKHSEKIEQTCKRVAKIIRGLKTYGRDGQMDPMEPISLHYLLHEIRDMYSEKIYHNNIELEIAHGPNIDNLSILGRNTQIFQAIVNLINNSIDAIENKERKFIHIEVEERISSMLIKIIDSGEGIPIQLKEKVLTPFFTTKLSTKGTGLGLAIVHKIMQEHSGKIHIICKDQIHSQPYIALEFPRYTIA